MPRPENIGYVWRTVVRRGKKKRVRMRAYQETKGVKPDMRLLPLGRGSRFYVKHKRFLTPELLSLKRKQDMTERRYGMRVGSALFQNPLADQLVITGRLYTPRRHQKHPHKKKLMRFKRGLSENPYRNIYRKREKPQPHLLGSGASQLGIAI